MHTKVSRRARAEALDRFAGRQFGAFTWAQALESGYPRATIAKCVEDGTFFRVHPTVYTRQREGLGLDTLRAAALLAVGSDAVLVRFAALDVFRCSRFRRRCVEVGTGRRCAKRLDGARLCRTHADAHGHVVVRGGHRVTSLPWTITDLGTVLEAEQIAHVIQQARLQCGVMLDDVDDVLRARGRFPGRAAVSAALRMYRAGSAGTRSHDEDVVYGWVKQFVRRPPLPNQHVQAGDQAFEVDIPFDRYRLCIEVDGPLHDDPEQQERDRVRDAALLAAGYVVVRIHWTDIRRYPRATRRRLRAVLRAHRVIR